MTSGARRSVLGARTEELLNERPNSDRALRVSDIEGIIAEAVLKVVKQAGYVVGGGGGGGGGGLTDGDYGDVTVSGGGVTMTVDAGAIGLSKMANLAASTILGRAFGAGTGVPQALTPAQVRRIAEGSNVLFHASTGATLTLTAASEDDIVLTGATSLTVVLPDVTTLTIGRTFRIRNTMGSGFQANVQSSGLNSINAVVNGMDAIYTVIALTGTDDTPWLYRIDGARTRTGSGNLVFSAAPTISNPVFTGTPVFPASVVGGASARIPHGVAPTAPVDGDVWTDTTGFYVRINGVTKRFGLSGLATVTPTLNSDSWRETVAAAGVSPTDRIIASLGAFADTDENDPEFLEIGAISAIPGTNDITFVMSFLSPTSGPIKLNWSVI